ncbi:MAG: HD domain-containing protein [Candidatus Marinimicrobia bacterium]|nr:HD domain-containing protein [Candidatus Neomarinimicrobiota bacterium]
MKLTQIRDFEVGKSIQGFYLCKQKHIRRTRNGDIFIDLTLQDSTGTISAKMWDMVDKFQNRFEQSDPVAVKGKVDEFNNEIQLTITQINFADDERYKKYGFNPDDLVRTINEPIDDLFKELDRLISDIKPKKLSELLNNIFKKYNEKVIVLHGSEDFHHPERGGFLKHLVSTAILAEKVADSYSDIDKDLLVAGCLLHDIGRVKEYDLGLEPTKNETGHLIDHTILGREILLEEISKIKNFPKELRLKLEHIIVSHQGNRYQMNNSQFKFPEALVVHYLDKIDGQLDMMLRIIEEDSNPGDWTDAKNYFRTELWKI